MALRQSPDDEPLGKEGVARLTAMMFAPKSHSQFEPNPQRFLEFRGSQMGVWYVKDRTVFAGFAPTADAAKDVIEDARRSLHDPAIFDPDLLEMFLRGPKIIFAAELERRERDPVYLANRELLRHLGPMIAAGRRRTGPTTRSVMSVTLKDVADYFRRAWHPEGAVLVFGGEVTPEQAAAYTHALLDDWSKRSTAASSPSSRVAVTPATQPVAVNEPARRRPRVIVIDASSALRATVRIGASAYDVSSPDRFAGAVAAHVLGTGVHSRLGTFVRTEKGYAYSIDASFVMTRTYGYFSASARTDSETAADAVATMLDVIAQVRGETGEVTDAELAAAKSYLAQKDVVQSEGTMQRVVRRLLREIGSASDDLEGIGRGGQQMREQLESDDVYDPRIDQVSAADVRAVIEKYVRPGAMTVVVVAPAAVVAGPLEKLGDVKIITPAQVMRETEPEQRQQETKR
jgi:zinc protease